MKYALLAAWILRVMLDQEPNAPWRGTYPATAETIAADAIDAPMFQGDDGPRKTASEMLSIGWFESHFNPKAEGDHECLKWEDQKYRVKGSVSPADGKEIEGVRSVCVKKGPPHSFCFFQISDSNFEWLGTTREKIQGSFAECLRVAHIMVHRSHEICRGRPKEDRLDWYTRGRDGCVSNDKGKHRVLKSGWIFAHYPVLAVE